MPAEIALARKLTKFPDAVRLATDNLRPHYLGLYLYELASDYSSFNNADTLFVTDIYAASEQPIEGITAEVLAGDISEKGGRPARYASSFADAVEKISEETREGDMVLTLGAGSVSQLGPMILEKLQARETVPQPI